MAADKTATYGVKLDDQVSAPANSAADSLEHLRARVAGGSDALKNMSADMRRLRGTTDEVKAAKLTLKTKIDAEKDAISAANLQILKAGKSYGELAAAHKKAKPETGPVDAMRVKTEGLASALTKTSGPLGDVGGKLQGLKGEAAGASEGMGLLTTASGILLGATLAVAAAIGSAVVALGRWIITSANAARSAGLMREAIAGSAQQGYALGTQIDALSRKVPTLKSDIQALSISLIKSKFGGQTLVDSMNAIGQASSALGDDIGNKLRAKLEGGILPNGREGLIGLTPQELLGTGLAFEDVAKALGESMKGGVAAARQALLAGRVPLAQGAAALRKAVDGKVGGINLAKMLDLNVMTEKFKETAAAVSRDVKIEPLLEGFSKIGRLFDEQTVTGSALHGIVTRLGNGIVQAFGKGLPFVAQFMKGLVIGVLTVEIAFYKLRNALRHAFADSEALQKLTAWTSRVDGMKLVLEGAKIAVISFALGLGVVATALAAVAASASITIGGFVALYEAGRGAWEKLSSLTWGTISFMIEAAFSTLKGKALDAWNALKSIDWAGAGKAIVMGLVEGLKSAEDLVINAIKGLADRIKSGFSLKLDIHSPSKVFEEYGRYTAEGYERGVEAGGPEARAAVDALAAPPATVGATGGQQGGASGGQVVFNAVFNFPTEASAREFREDASFIAKLTQALEEMSIGAGVPAGSS